jgi:hypothetical protein
MKRPRSIEEIPAYPLQWPDGWIRAKPVLRQGNYSWKRTFGIYRSDLLDELRRLGARDAVISTDIPLNRTNGLPREGFNPPDPGVAVYFRRESQPDTRWQDLLQIPDDWETRFPRETALELVNRQFRRLSVHCHPDTHPKDAPLFYQLNAAKQQAVDTISGKSAEDHQYSLACDKFGECRLNFHAIALTINSLRQIERCGATSMLERAFRGFQMALPARGETSR